jgi:hypothetical protein
MSLRRVRYLACVWICLVASHATAAEESELSLADLRARLSALDHIAYGDEEFCASMKQDIEQTDKFAVVGPAESLAAYDPALPKKYAQSCPATALNLVPGFNPSGHHEEFLNQRAHGAFKLYSLDLDEPGKTAILMFGRKYMTDGQWETYGSAKDFPANLPQGVLAMDNYSILIPKECKPYFTNGAQTVGYFGVIKDESGVFKSGSVNYIVEAFTTQADGDGVNVEKVAYDKYLGAEPKPTCVFLKK